jgi:chemotaxis protein methyltransferase CheR
VVDEYGEFCSGLRRLTGVDLTSYKRAQMERRIRTYVDRKAAPTLSAFLRHIQTSPADLDDFLDRITINVSELYRNPEQYELLRTRVLGELRPAAAGLRAWSAGCSYGAEPYTLAAVCRLAAPGATATILGTDIDRRAIERARRGGEFTDEDIRDAPRLPLERFFKHEGRHWRPAAELRTTVSFEVGDLLKLRPPTAAYDLVLCRNTAIYFTDDVRDAMHARLADSVRPGGVLVVGATERIGTAEAIGLEFIAPFTYRKA